MEYTNFVLNAIRSYAEKHPGVRVGQLLVSIAQSASPTSLAWLYHVEDEVLGRHVNNSLACRTNGVVLINNLGQ